MGTLLMGLSTGYLGKEAVIPPSHKSKQPRLCPMARVAFHRSEAGGSAL